ncbi:MAG: hypothetical protein LUF78_08630 [Clostridiales bacterium]|nr:hypothetical protein [Clostridiales bacterium]
MRQRTEKNASLCIIADGGIFLYQKLPRSRNPGAPEKRIKGFFFYYFAFENRSKK